MISNLYNIIYFSCSVKIQPLEKKEFVYGILFDDINILNNFENYENLIENLEYNKESDLIKIKNLKEENSKFVRILILISFRDILKFSTKKIPNIFLQYIYT